MKKLLALLLAAVMVLALCACGAKTEEPAADAPAAEETAAPDANVPGEAAAPAEEPVGDASGEMGGDAAAPDFSGVDTLNITFNCSYNENETGGVLAAYFKDYLEKITNNAITVNIAFGGTLAVVDDELDFCGDGAIDMMIFGHTRHNDQLPVLCSIPDFAPDSIANALDYFHYIMNDAVAGPAIQAEAEANGIKYLSVNAGGANYFLANFPFSNLTEMIEGSAAFGNAAPAKFEALGLTLVDVFPWDYYSAFDTGLMDASQMDGPAMYSMGLYEVAKYWMPDNTFAAGNFITANLDWWNGLTADQQAAIQAAADATTAYSLEYNQSEYEKLNDNLVANGVTLAEMTDAEFDQWWSAIFDTIKNDSMAKAAENGNTEEVQAVLQAAADFTNYEITF